MQAFKNFFQKIRSGLSKNAKTLVFLMLDVRKKLIILLSQLFLKLANFTREVFVVNAPIFAGITFSLLITLLYKLTLDLNLMKILGLENDITTMQGFIEWLGIPYSFIISMIFVRAWERADSIGNSIMKETHAISVFFDKICSIPIDSSPEVLAAKSKFISNIYDYMKFVDDNYSIEHKNPDRKVKGDEKLIEIKQEVKLRFETKAENLHLQLIQSIDDVMSARSDRLLNSNLRVQSSVWMLLLVSSLLWLAPFIFIVFHNLWLGYLLFGSITFIVVMTLITIYFFNRPTHILWNDTSKSWEALRTKVTASI